MKTRRFLTTLCVLTISLTVAWAQGPNNSGIYYKNADGKKGAALKTAMCGIIYNHTERSYNDLWTDFRTTDKRPTDGKVWDMYSGISSFTFGTNQDTGSHTPEGTAYNREHSFPKSWFGGEVTPMYTDLFHMYPTDGYVNEKRSNYPFGENNGEVYSSSGGFSKLGKCTYPGCTYTGNKEYVFEPNDLYKGDFARTYFYMVTCYEEKIVDWYNSYADSRPTLDGNKYPGLSSWQLSMLMKWAKNDTVSAKETARNNAVYGIQKNRNPFIDYPGLEEYIWGEWRDVAFSYDNYVNPYNGETPATVANPTFSPAAGTYTSAQSVTISCSTSGATIYYTTNGSTPTASSSLYSSAITISETTTLKAVAIKDGTSSSVATATYTISSGGGPTPITGDGIFEKVLSTSELESGKRYIIVSGTHALTKLDGKAGSGSVTISSSQIDMNNSSNTALILTMEKDGNYWTINSNDGYMALTSNNNTLNSSTTATENTAKWTISVNSGTASVTNVNYSNRSLKYNTSNDMFRCYTSGQADVEIYKELEPTTTPGDVVKDGEVTFADLKALVKILLGIDASGDGEIDEDAADVNEDGKKNIADVTKLVNLLLKQQQN